MSFLKKLFGGGGGDASASTAAAPKTLKSAEHNGYAIDAQPYFEAGQYQLCGVITRTVDGEVKSHKFVRADRFATIDDAADMTILKGRQIIDQNGDRIFG